MPTRYSPANLFGMLSSDIRAEILKGLTDDGPTTISQFLELHCHDNRKSDITIQGLSKHFKKLAEAHLVKRNNDGSFSTTPLGHTVRWQLQSFELFTRYEAYFNSHATNRLPKKFAQEIGVLRNSTVIEGRRHVLGKARSAIGSTNKYLKIAVISYATDIVPLIAKRTKGSSLRVSYLFGRNTQIPKRRTYLLTKSGWWNLLSTGLVERKMTGEDLVASILVTEKDAMISFCKSNGTPDLGTAFYGSDASFWRWCNNLFAHMWYNAGTFYESGIVEKRNSSQN